MYNLNSMDADKKTDYFLKVLLVTLILMLIVIIYFIQQAFLNEKMTFLLFVTIVILIIIPLIFFIVQITNFITHRIRKKREEKRVVKAFKTTEIKK